MLLTEVTSMISTTRAIRDARYNRSEKGRARHGRYNQSEKGHARTRRYEGAVKSWARKRRYELSIKGIITRERGYSKRRRVVLAQERADILEHIADLKRQEDELLASLSGYQESQG
jgi:hypothetical protein